jgi:hypothetical protein
MTQRNKNIKNNNINNANILLENRFILEKIGEESMVNSLTNKVKVLTQKVNNGENLEKELQNAISKLILVLKDDSIDENKIVEGVFDYAKIALISGLMALGMSNAQAQSKIDNSINISSVNKSAEVELSNNLKLGISRTINGYLNEGVNQIIIEIVGKASLVTPPAGMTNEELATKRAEKAKEYIEAKYGNKVMSDKAPAYPFYALNYQPSSWLKFNYMHAWLESGVLDTRATYDLNNKVYGGVRQQYLPKFFATHSVEIAPMKGLKLNLGESIMYSENLQLAYMLPVTFFIFKLL